MSTASNIAQTRLEDLINAIGSRQVSPGAGAAGAVTLALAAACTAKAVADRDAEAFAAFIKEHTSRAITQVIREGDRNGRLIAVLSEVIEQVAPHIESNMSGDLLAARALTQAAHKIQAANSSEARDEKALLHAKS